MKVTTNELICKGCGLTVAVCEKKPCVWRRNTFPKWPAGNRCTNCGTEYTLLTDEQIKRRQRLGLPRWWCGECIMSIAKANNDAADRAALRGMPNLLEDLVIKDNPVNPIHYRRGPEIALGPCNSAGTLQGFTRSRMQRAGKLWITLDCIDVFRAIKDPRLATAVKYIWRVAFGGKTHENPKEAILKAIWYLNDFCDTLPPTDNNTALLLDTTKANADVDTPGAMRYNPPKGNPYANVERDET